MEVKPVSEGDVVIFVDTHGRDRFALVTAVHGHFTKEERDENYRNYHEKSVSGHKEYGREQLIAQEDKWLEDVSSKPFVPPSLNLVYVSNDPSQVDSAGRQVAPRATSVPHEQGQAAHGFYWRNLIIDVNEDKVFVG